MVQIITPDVREHYQDLLDDMFRMRYRIVVEKWGWDIPGIEPGYDKDQFDTDDTIYIVETDQSREKAVACTRLNPTTKPHMFSELWAPQCNLQPYPTGDAIYECSRYISDRAAFETKQDEFLAVLRTGVGLTEYCLEAGVERLTWLTREKLYNVAIAVWETEPLGRPWHHEVDNDTYIPATSKIDITALTKQRATLPNPNEAVSFTYRPVGAQYRKAA
ncbi:MAG: acyl-homoserine-lactone synthase [Pseudomonadota bacterium]